MVSLIMNKDGRRHIICYRAVFFWRMLIPDELVPFGHECGKKVVIALHLVNPLVSFPGVTHGMVSLQSTEEKLLRG